MSSLQRSISLLAVCCWAATFQFGPTLLGLSDSAAAMSLAVSSLLSPLAAALSSFWAASLSEGSDRKAWRSFGAGCSLYFFGNLCYVYYGLSGVVAAFPTWPELSYFLMAICFTVGMFQYGAAKHLISRIQVYNFALILLAAAVSASFLLHQSLATSRLQLLGTTFAFFYPVLWFSVACFGLVCLLLYAHSGKRFVFTLLLLAIVSEAAADLLYARALMADTYRVGGLATGLWTLSTALLIWAAFEQMHLGRLGASLTTDVLTVARRRLAEASVPGVAVAVVLGSASAAAALTGYGTVFLAFSVPAVVAFSALIGIREHWGLSVERDLRGVAQQSQSDLAASRHRLSAVLESTTDSVLVLDREWRIAFFNRQAAETIGCAGKPMLGMGVLELFTEEVGASLDQRFRQAVRTGEAVGFEQYVPGRDVWLDVNAFPTAEGLSIFFRDISETRRVREEITHLALHDPLTGLANRILFRNKIRAIADVHSSAAALFLDLDQFKEVNDTLGHPVGDALLCQLAERMRDCVSEPDAVARLGGDEFALVETGISSSVDASALAQRILDVVSAPYVVEGHTVRIGASIGVALAPTDGIDPDHLFKNADIALYCSKADGRGTYRIFEPAMETLLQERQKLKSDLIVALEDSQFELAFQPIIDLHSNKVCCFEALLRWHHPVHGNITPDTFIPIAEEMGLIVPIGNWVIERACAEASKWADGIRVAVNLSTRQFVVDDLPELVESILIRTRLPAHRLELEITESALLQDSEANLQTLQRLRQLGVRIALDDFGTGYASLGYLQKFPFSKIKIDRSFVNNLPDRAESRAIVAAVTGLGRALGIPITAEGVETRQQLDRVRGHECDEAQGFFFNRAVAAEDIPLLLEKLRATEKFWGEPIPRRRTGPEYAIVPSA